MTSTPHIRARAPGKVVLWGEYAVLAGAPALVQAVDRYAHCHLGLAESGWRFATHGFRAPSVHLSLTSLKRPKPPPQPAASLAWHVLQDYREDELPAGVTTNTHSDDFFSGGQKLGLGSSAAICVVLHAAYAALVGKSPNFDRALRAHQRAQGGRGSGIDVAASFYGGLLRYQAEDPQPIDVDLPPRVFVWAGSAAATTAHLRRFSDYRKRGDHAELDALATTSAALLESASLDELAEYCRRLHALDDAGGLGIYSTAHLVLEQLAIDHQLVYKPCGAGGGDIGVAFTGPDMEATSRFRSAVKRAGFTVLTLETANHGIEVSA